MACDVVFVYIGILVMSVKGASIELNKDFSQY